MYQRGRAGLSVVISLQEEKFGGDSVYRKIRRELAGVVELPPCQNQVGAGGESRVAGRSLFERTHGDDDLE